MAHTNLRRDGNKKLSQKIKGRMHEFCLKINQKESEPNLIGIYFFFKVIIVDFCRLCCCCLCNTNISQVCCLIFFVTPVFESCVCFYVQNLPVFVCNFACCRRFLSAASKSSLLLNGRTAKVIRFGASVVVVSCSCCSCFSSV